MGLGPSVPCSACSKDVFVYVHGQVFCKRCTAAKAEEPMWQDAEDQWSKEICDAHPTRSGSHDEYRMAMQMVGHRHSKGELVALVNWLLVRLK